MDESSQQDTERRFRALIENSADGVAIIDAERRILYANRALERLFDVPRAQLITVLGAASGPDALALCENHEGKIDLLLTDVIMPRMNGRQLAESFTSLRPAARVVFMSGYTEDAILHDGVRSAGIAFLQKPVVPDALLRKLREVLDGGDGKHA